MYGGKIETNNGNVTDELWVFNIPSQTWSTRTPAVLIHGQQYAVEGHSAHIIELDSRDVVMIVIFGYSAIYGYTSLVQEYYISKSLSKCFYHVLIRKKWIHFVKVKKTPIFWGKKCMYFAKEITFLHSNYVG